MFTVSTIYHMKHFIAETHLPKDGPLHRYLGVDAENAKEARKQLEKLLEDKEYLVSIRSLTADRVAH